MAEIKYISGMKMGYFIENFLKKNNKYNPKNYKDCYEYCKMNCNHMTNGKTGKATRYLYLETENKKYVSKWYNKHTV